MNKSKQIIILLTEHNFIDQMTPIIELLYENNYDIKLIKVLHHYDYKNDHNLKYLINKYPKLQITDLFLDNNKLYIKLHNSYNYFNMKLSLNNIKIKKYFWHFFAGITHKFIENNIKINNTEIKKIFSNNKEKCTIITDIDTGDYNYEVIRKQVVQLNITNITFTHALNMFKNELLTDNQISKNKIKSIIREVKYADKIVLFDSVNKIKTKQNYQCDIEVLPSLRYSSKWINKIGQKINKFSTVKKYKLKMVFMMSTLGYNVWKEEEYRTIQSILLDNDIYLVLKLHPRDMRSKNKYLKVKNSNFKVIANEISSSALIDWADVVINIGSSILMEAIVKKKTIFYMKYLHCNSITVEDVPNAVHRIETRDQLIDLLERFKDNKQEDTKSKEARSEFLKDYIGNDNFEENQKKYLELFESL